MLKRCLVISAVFAQLFMIACNNGEQQISEKAINSVPSAVSDTAVEVEQNLKIQKILVFDKSGRQQHVDVFQYNEQGKLSAVNSGETLITYGTSTGENSISVSLNDCLYTLKYDEKGMLYQLHQVGPDWKMNLDVETESQKLKSIKTQEIGFSQHAIWEGDNLKSFSEFDEEESTTTTYTYGKLLNKFGFDIIGYLACTENRLPYMNVRYLAKETLSKNLPTSIVVTTKTEEGGMVEEKFNLDYEVDLNGRVKTISVTGRKKFEIVYVD